MRHRNLYTRTVAAVTAAGGLTFGIIASAQDRPLAWVRSGPTLERDLNAHAARGLLFAAVSDGLPDCAVVVMQATAGAPDSASYRVVSDRRLSAALDGLVQQGFVPRAAARSLGPGHDVIFERMTPSRPSGAWRLVEFDKLENLLSALAGPAAEGYRPVLLVRPAFRSWPGLSERGLVLAMKASGAAPLDVQLHTATRRNVGDLARDVEAATSSGWRFDLLFAHTRDGGPRGRRERATVVLSKPRTGAGSAAAVRIERRASFGVLGDVVVGAAAYWDEVLVATVKVDRRQAWASPVRLDARDADCGPLGFTFQSAAPRDHTWPITALVAKPATKAGDYELLVVSDQNMNFR